MKRREFMMRGAGTALLGALPLGATAGWSGPLLDDPEAWVGRTFRIEDGTELTLAAVETLPTDGRSRQARLQFTVGAGSPPREGTHALRCGVERESLFLQSGRDG
jgi:hypothetical protein